MQNISEIEELIKLISKLPGLGPKSAKRIVLKLVNNRNELVKPLANTLAQVYKNVVRCNLCGTLKSNSYGCLNCENTKNRFTKICSIISNNAFFNKELYVDLDLVKPQPKIVTNNGAANPPKPAIV